jgi:hypothetical protein
MNSGADWNGQNGNLTTVGSAGNTSFYGAFDMNGNVREWIQDTAFSQGFRGQKGGDLFSGFNANPNFVFGLDPAFVNYSVPTIESVDQGIRFASPALPPPCDDIDFNNNGVFPEDQDVIDFFDVLAGGNPASCNAVQGCNDIDFNNNGVFPEDQDVVDFFNVLAGGNCP